MSRRLSRLTVDNLADLPGGCRRCVFWELDPVNRAHVGPEAALSEKESWVSHVLLEWGSCGRVLYVDEQPVGYAIYAPPAFVPGGAAFPTGPVSPDAVMLTSAMVLPDHAGGGLGRVLVQGMAKDLVSRGGIRAVEAFGYDGPMRSAPGAPAGAVYGGCVVPAEFLSRVGFRTARAHPRYPRMRLDLKSALTWRSEVEAALERLLGAVRPRPVPTHPVAGSHGRIPRQTR